MPDIVPQVVALVLLVVSGFFTIRELALYLKERNRKSLGSPPPPPKSNPQLEEENKRLRQELVAVQTDLQWAKKRIEQLERGLERSIGPQEVEEMRREIRELKIQNEELRTENAALKERIRPLQEKADHANVLKKLYHDIKFERRKSNVSEFETFVKSKNIVCLYHVTERENLPNIQKYGLLSWKFIEEMKLFVPAYVSDDISRNLDKRSKLEDYVRLSFTRSIPMMHQKIAEGKAVDLVVLCIDKQVLFWEDTLFSDRNATAGGAKFGPTYDHLKNIRFDVVLGSKPYYQLSEEEKPFYQAEVMVKTHVPRRMIINLDNPEPFK